MDAKVVGAHLTFQGSPSTGSAEPRILNSCDSAARLGGLPVGFDLRALLLQSAVLPKGMFACS
eukprot:10891412-Karenia_brevis.AAC.1